MRLGSMLRLLDQPIDPPAEPLAALGTARHGAAPFHVPAAVRFAREALTPAREAREIAAAKLTLAIADARLRDLDVSAPVAIANRELGAAEAGVTLARDALDAENVKWTPSVIAALAPARTVAMARLASCCLGVAEACADLRGLDQTMIREGLEPPTSLSAPEIEALRRVAADLVRGHRWSRDAL